jgi:hypothetical protein
MDPESKSGPDASPQTTELRADIDQGIGSADEGKSEEEFENGSVMGSGNSGSSISTGKKKKTKRQKRKAKLQSAEKEEVIAEARGGWHELQRTHELCMKAADDCMAFDTIREMKMTGGTKRDFREGFMEAERRFETLHAKVIECGRRLAHIVAAHPSILRARRDFLEKPPSQSGTFDEEFEIL